MVLGPVSCSAKYIVLPFLLCEIENFRGRGVDPRGPEAMPLQAALFPIVNNSVKKLFT